MTTNEIRPSAENTEAEETLGGVAFDSIEEPEQDSSGDSRRSGPKPARASVETLTERAVTTYLESIQHRRYVSPQKLRDSALSRINAEIALENMGRKRSSAPALAPVHRLDEYSVIQILLSRHRLVTVDLTGGHGDEDNGVLAIYEDDGPLRGLYNTSVPRLKRLVSELRPSFTDAGVESTLRKLRTHAPIVMRTQEPRLIPVANGVFDHATQQLREFSPEWVFLSKIQRDYDPTAQSPRIKQSDGTEWEVEEWFNSLSDDAGIPELLWQVVSATLRPHHPWNKSVFLVGTDGNGGKGTLVSLLRNLVGEAACASISLARFGDRFGLGDLITRSVNLVDENPVGAFASRTDDWKACVTGDVFQVEFKGKDVIHMRWNGIEVHCLNETSPRIKDKSKSVKRRMLLVPMTKDFSGSENVDIKLKYLRDPEVLGYVLKRALQMTHIAFDEPIVSKQAVDRWFTTNNKVVGWWEEHEDQFVWDLLPWSFLYDAYKGWYSRVEPSGTVEGLNQFTETLREHLKSSTAWSPTNTSVRPGTRMSSPEPLIDDLRLTDWMNTNYSGSDPNRRCLPTLKTNYKGLLRTQSAGTTPDEDDG
ncbi:MULTISPECIES: DNA primase family protein [Microbacterium]|nr:MULTISPECIES: phage/plasmid primase, P4 family [Microbacterium]MDH5132204.1 phage/plasmid primase, P4 family [Microbacterium sp. RD10]MDH5135497.1 phage/plasmid primase, P4 family [Microbacterium sp. RD11]MDH5143597.1 phage/plasmid primase, P4 family [Microbacterium sp. RD12]MDH5154275.1 phage/plasmid primase, P4 family [Microbacterium sp. RD06]MDH5164557.1 phage/plasmid primase, P4 family [Microbacterium sp. RD02]